MTEISEKKSINISLKKTGKQAKIPVKRTINLVEAGEDHLNTKAAIPGVILVLLIAVLFGKFCVADRLVAMNQAQSEVARLNSELTAAYNKLNSFDALHDEYAHYTFSGMTREELELADRPAVIELIERVVLPGEVSNTWTLSGNQLTIEIEGETLQQINLLARELEKDPLVSFCTVSTANMQEVESTVIIPVEPDESDYVSGDLLVTPTPQIIINEDTIVHANVIVYLQNASEVEQ